MNIAWKTKCYISKFKLILCEYNAFYYSEIDFIDFTLHEIKHGIVFFGTPGIYVYKQLRIKKELRIKRLKRLQLRIKRLKRLVSAIAVRKIPVLSPVNA